MSVFDRVSVIVGVILVGVVLGAVLDIPSRAFQFQPLGTPLTLHITGPWVMSAILVGLCCAGTEAIMRTHPAVRRGTTRYTFPSWILPGLTTIALATLLPESPSFFAWVAGLALGGAMLAWLIVADYHTYGTREHSETALQVGLRLIAFVLSLVFFAVIYRTRLRSLVTATTVSLVSSTIALYVLFSQRSRLDRSVLYAAAIGLIMGQTTWALNYWRMHPLSVGVLLMLLFYVLVGIVREHVRGQFSRQVVLEFLAVAILGIWVIVRFGPQ
jgi:intracellular septation protein A